MWGGGAFLSSLFGNHIKCTAPNYLLSGKNGEKLGKDIRTEVGPKCVYDTLVPVQGTSQWSVRFSEKVSKGRGGGGEGWTVVSCVRVKKHNKNKLEARFWGFWY